MISKSLIKFITQLREVYNNFSLSEQKYQTETASDQDNYLYTKLIHYN